MKTLFTAVLAFLFLPAVFATDPLPADWATELLREQFPDYTNAVWKETDKTYEVKFMEEDVRCWLVLDKKSGTKEALVRYYNESHLPSHVKDFLHEDFPDTKIAGVTEVNVDNRRVYQVNVEGKKHWYIVRIDDNLNMNIKDTFKKSN